MHASSCIVWERGNLGCSTIQITSQFYHFDIYCFKLQNSKFENQSRIKWAILQTCDHIACCTIVLLSRRSQMSKWGSVLAVTSPQVWKWKNIAEMADTSHEICEKTDALDAAGITTVVIGKVIFFQFYFLKMLVYIIS